MPLEVEICRCAIRLNKAEVAEFHGYEMAKELARSHDRQSLAAYGTLYRALARLVDMGMMESRWEDPMVAARESRPLRRFYTLTAAGRRAAHEAEQSARPIESLKRARKGWAPA